MANDKGRIKIGIELDEREAKEVRDGLSSVANASKRLESGAGKSRIPAELQQVQKMVESVDKAYQHLGEQVKKATTPEDFNSIKRQLKDVKDEVNFTTRSFSLQGRALRAEAAAITDDFAKARVAYLKNISGQLGQFSGLALGAGVGIVGGIFAAASKHVKDAKAATAADREWQQAQDDLAHSGQQVSEVFVKEALPLLKEAATLAGKAAGFVQEHPDIVRAALNTGIVLASLGAVGLAVSKGIKIYADIQAIALGTQQLAAAKLQDIAADKQLAAAQLRAAGAEVSLPSSTPLITKTAAGGGIASLLVDATVALAAFTGGLLVGDKIFDRLQQHDQKFADYITTFKQALALDAKGLGDIFAGKQLKILGQPVGQPIDPKLGEKWFDKVRDALFEVKKASDEAGASLSVVNSKNFDQILKAYSDYKTADLELVRQHYADRQKIVAGALKDELAANEKYASDVKSAQRQESKDLAAAASAYNKADQQSDKKYAEDRRKILEDANTDVLKIEEDLQEKLRTLRLEYNEREVDSLAARDAVSLIKNRQKYLKDQFEAQRTANKEIADRRADIGKRLADLQQSYEEEKAQRLADYKERVAEIQANAKEQLDNLREKHNEEIKEIRRARDERLKELDVQLKAERERRRTALIAQITELDAYLLGTKKLTEQRHAEMITELDAWLTAMRTKFQNLPVPATASNAFGGYAGYGLHMLGDSPSGGKGPEEFVMTGSTVKTAERLVGRRLSQQAILAKMMAGGSGGQTITLNDHRYFNSRISAQDRREIREETQQMIIDLVAR